MQRVSIPVTQLTVDALQSRKTAWVGDETDQQLASLIESTGLLHDLIVRPLESSDTDIGDVTEPDQVTHAVVAGSRRYYAALEVGYQKVPCKVIDTDDIEAAWTSLTENTDRRDLSEQERAQQLKLIYEMTRPREEPTACPECEQTVKGEAGLYAHYRQTACTLPRDPEQVATETDASAIDRFLTDRQAVQYIASRYLDRADETAVSRVPGHLRTANLPPVIQALFEKPANRTDEERMALENYGINVSTRLGSGEGRSGTSRAVAALYDTLTKELTDETALAPTDAVLETVGSLSFEEMSERELQQSLREFRQDVSDRLQTETAE